MGGGLHIPIRKVKDEDKGDEYLRAIVDMGR